MKLIPVTPAAVAEFLRPDWVPSEPRPKLIPIVGDPREFLKPRES